VFEDHVFVDVVLMVSQWFVDVIPSLCCNDLSCMRCCGHCCVELNVEIGTDVVEIRFPGFLS
jgi:hypothetical protein